MTHLAFCDDLTLSQRSGTGAVCPGCAEKKASLNKVRADLTKANRYIALLSDMFAVLERCPDFQEATRSSYVQGELLIWLNQCLEANKITVDEYEKLVSRIRS
ncbi:MAG: hypothetical protein DMG24_01075 [Acidobacteria bacterium]|nr:MAG: hypothetical protein DMG24_01075 [Acidobacteriota bacterium]